MRERDRKRDSALEMKDYFNEKIVYILILMYRYIYFDYFYTQ